MTPCICVFDDRKHEESEREWLKRCMCMNHWMQTDYYRNKYANPNSQAYGRTGTSSTGGE